ncbi:MAG: hypothetical protein L6R28_20735 [Planctomycetes bacterium]|nr:hypothetical protein [Planctomycetota bacterium]
MTSEPQAPNSGVTPGVFVLRWLWVTVLSANGLLAVTWWHLMPHGFAISHPRFWSNTVLPCAALVVCVSGIGAFLVRRMRFVRLVAFVCAGFWAGTGGYTLLLIPSSGFRLGMVCTVSGLVLVVFAWRVAGGTPARCEGRLVFAALLAGAAPGVLLLSAMRSDASSTNPSNHPLALAPASDAGDDPAARENFALRDGVSVFPEAARFAVRANGLVIEIQPLLTFVSRSPDRFWTNFAPPGLRREPARKLSRAIRDPARAAFEYHGSFMSRMEVRAADGEAPQIEAVGRLDRETYSHLNTFTDVGIAGAKRLFLSFSPCPESRIEVLASDYPFGRPARFAYLGADGIFRVLQASDAEKGPYTELASGPLARDEPLAIALYDGERFAARLVFRDWAAQASTELSPSAGWGVAQNAIEFSRIEELAAPQFRLVLTLAGTSVGRGFDSVGHAPGVYWNRMRVELEP